MDWWSVKARICVGLFKYIVRKFLSLTLLCLPFIVSLFISVFLRYQKVPVLAIMILTMKVIEESNLLQDCVLA